MNKIFRRIFIVLALSMSLQASAIVSTDSLYSEVLGEWVKYNVYRPANFDDSGATRYPVLYQLHGLSDFYGSWNNNAQIGEVVDQLLAENKIREMVIIMPNAGGPDTRNTWNGYFNMPGHNYEDFFFQELVPTVEKKYHIVDDKEHRAISGLSMGGGGSTVYCQKHPDMFSSCYAMSAWLDNSDNLQEAEVNKLYYVIRAVQENSALRFVEQADDATLEKLRTVKWFFDIGDDDFLLEQSEKLHMLMRNKRVKAELRVRDGNHSWGYWKSALYTSLPFISRNFADDSAAQTKQ